MKITWSIAQYKTLSAFCNDVAKGLMLAGILGQGIAESLSVDSKIIISFVYLFLSLLLLYFALICSRRAKI